MDSDASFLLSPCVLLSEGAALTMALRLGCLPGKARAPLLAFLSGSSCLFPILGHINIPVLIVAAYLLLENICLPSHLEKCEISAHF